MIDKEVKGLACRIFLRCLLKVIGIFIGAMIIIIAGFPVGVWVEQLFGESPMRINPAKYQGDHFAGILVVGWETED